MPQLTIDGSRVVAPDGINLIEAARLAGRSIPHYCYHSKLSIAGNCRICLVEIEKQPKLQIGCNTPVQEGMVVFTTSRRVLEARQSVMEFLLVNHPIDCPVCDQAGECKLQKYYMHHDLKPSRMVEPKVRKKKAVPLGPHVMLDMERCILCSRCIRFCKEIAKDEELCFTQRGNRTELTAYPGKALDNPYSLNTVDICPVGALTSRDFRFRQRVWFLKKTDSICPGCSTGCSIEIHHNRGVIYRLVPRANPKVNDGWMCDEGRETYKPVNATNRLRTPLVRLDGRPTECGRVEAVEAAAEILRGVDGGQVVGIGSAEFTTEDNQALIDLLKPLGVTEFYYLAREVPNPSSDKFLISPDKNPNRAGVEGLGMRPLPSGRRYRVVVVLGILSGSQLAAVALENDCRAIFFTTHRTAEVEAADLVFPVATFAEQEGSFTNRKGMVQKIDRAIEPPGEARVAREFLAEIGGAR